MKKITLTAFVLLLGVLTLQVDAFAYLPPSFFIVRQLAHKHSDLKSVTIKSRITFFDGSTPKTSPLNETISVSDAGKITVVVKSAEGQVVATLTRNIEESAADLPLLYGLSLISNSSALYGQLKSAGIPVKTETQLYADKNPAREDLPYQPEETVSLGRTGNRIVLVLSADGKQGTEPPQLWVDKGSLLPVRSITRTDNGEALEIRFDQHGVYQTSFYPKTIEVLRNGKNWAHIELTEVKALQGALTPVVNRISNDAGSLSSDLEAYMKWLR